MYTADVHNIVFGKLNKILQYPICSLYMYVGSKRGKYLMVLQQFASDWMTFPPLYSLYCYNRYKYKNTLFTREVQKYTCDCHVWNVILQPLKKFRNIPCHKSRDIRWLITFITTDCISYQDIEFLERHEAF